MRPFATSALLISLVFAGVRPSPADSFTAPVQVLHGSQSGSAFGLPVAGAGDVDGDGYEDVIVSAFAWDGGAGADQGRIFVYRGWRGGIRTTPAWTVGSNHPAAQFGIAAAGAGDVDGDGYADIVVGASTDSVMNEGRAFLYRGGPAGLDTVPAWQGRGVQWGSNYGISVCAAGDVNGDGFDDVAVGAGTMSNGSMFVGAVFVYYGSPSGLSATGTRITGLIANEWFGWQVRGAGDVNGDGHDDLVVGALYSSHPESQEGRAYVYLGSPTGIQTSPWWYRESDDSDANMGWSVDGAGDLDGDGYDDVIVGAHHFSANPADPAFGPGAVFVYRGGPDSLTLDATLWGLHNLAHFGQSLARIGDLDGDGISEFVVGAYNSSNTKFQEGRLQHFRGTAGGLDASPSWTWDGGIVQLGIGASLACAGDVNGDGHPDIVAGCSHEEAVLDEPGAVYVFLGEPAAPVAVPAGPRAAADALMPPTPTPFSSRTVLVYSLAAPGPARIAIHDLAGRRVRTLLDGEAAAAGRAAWDGRDDRGLPCHAGVYVARLSTGRGSAIRRVVYLP